MPYSLRIAVQAQFDIDSFLYYLARFNADIVSRFERDLIEAVERHVLTNPWTWPSFPLTGEPYKGYLFRVSRRSSYWVVYRIDEGAKAVDWLRFWSSARNPLLFEIQ